MAKKEKFERIHSDVKELDKIERKIRLTRDKKKCMCAHQRKNGVAAIKMRGNGFAICQECKKDDIEVKLNPFREENLSKIDEHWHYIDSVVDLIKMSIDMNNPEDIEVLSGLSKFQFFGRNNLPELVAGVSRRNNKMRKNQNRQDREGSPWGKPIVR